MDLGRVMDVSVSKDPSCTKTSYPPRERVMKGEHDFLAVSCFLEVPCRLLRPNSLKALRIIPR